MNLKFKKILITLSMSIIAILSMTFPITSCSNNESNYFNENFISSQTNLDKTIKGVSQLKYNKIKSVIVSSSLLDKFETDEKTAYNRADNWLNMANKNQIEDMLLINFNLNSIISSFQLSNSLDDFDNHWTSWCKLIYDVDVLKYDYNTHVVDFVLNVYNNIYQINDKYKNEVNILEGMFYDHIEYEFKNIKLVPTKINNKNGQYIPSITIVLVDNLNIKINNVNCQHYFDYDYYRNLIKFGFYNGWYYGNDLINKNKKDELLKVVDLLEENSKKSFSSFKKIKNLKWNYNNFNNDIEYCSSPFVDPSESYYLEYPGIKFTNNINNIHYVYTSYSKYTMSKPKFIIGEFINESNDIKFLDK